jgi:phosphocarrier protein
MLTKELEISNKLGLHARAAAKLVELAGRFESEVWLRKEGRRVDAKSIMGIMMLAAGRGTVVEVGADGPDEEEALSGVEGLIRDRFGEPE